MKLTELELEEKLEHGKAYYDKLTTETIRYEEKETVKISYAAATSSFWETISTEPWSLKDYRLIKVK
jgi:hypothetical protein